MLKLHCVAGKIVLHVTALSLMSAVVTVAIGVNFTPEPYYSQIMKYLASRTLSSVSLTINKKPSSRHWKKKRLASPLKIEWERSAPKFKHGLRLLSPARKGSAIILARTFFPSQIVFPRNLEKSSSSSWGSNMNDKVLRLVHILMPLIFAAARSSIPLPSPSLSPCRELVLYGVRVTEITVPSETVLPPTPFEALFVVLGVTFLMIYISLELDCCIPPPPPYTITFTELNMDETPLVQEYYDYSTFDFPGGPSDLLLLKHTWPANDGGDDIKFKLAIFSPTRREEILARAWLDFFDEVIVPLKLRDSEKLFDFFFEVGCKHDDMLVRRGKNAVTGTMKFESLMEIYSSILKIPLTKGEWDPYGPHYRYVEPPNVVVEPPVLASTSLFTFGAPITLLSFPTTTNVTPNFSSTTTFGGGFTFGVGSSFATTPPPLASPTPTTQIPNIFPPFTSTPSPNFATSTPLFGGLSFGIPPSTSPTANSGEQPAFSFGSPALSTTPLKGGTSTPTPSLLGAPETTAGVSLLATPLNAFEATSSLQGASEVITTSSDSSFTASTPSTSSTAAEPTFDPSTPPPETITEFPTFAFGIPPSIFKAPATTFENPLPPPATPPSPSIAPPSFTFNPLPPNTDSNPPVLDPALATTSPFIFTPSPPLTNLFGAPVNPPSTETGFIKVEGDFKFGLGFSFSSGSTGGNQFTFSDTPKSPSFSSSTNTVFYENSSSLPATPSSSPTTEPSLCLDDREDQHAQQATSLPELEDKTPPLSPTLIDPDYASSDEEVPGAVTPTTTISPPLPFAISDFDDDEWELEVKPDGGVIFTLKCPVLKLSKGKAKAEDQDQIQDDEVEKDFFRSIHNR